MTTSDDQDGARRPLTTSERQVAEQLAAGNLPRLRRRTTRPDGLETEELWRVRSSRTGGGQHAHEYQVIVTANADGVRVDCGCAAGAHGRLCWHAIWVGEAVAGRMPYADEISPRPPTYGIPNVALLCGKPEEARR